MPDHAVLGISLSTMHRTQMWISAQFVTEYMPRSLSKNVRLHSMPLVVLHLFEQALVHPPAIGCEHWPRMLCIYTIPQTQEKEQLECVANIDLRKGVSDRQWGHISNKLSELLILQCTNLENRYCKSRLLSRRFLLYILGLPNWETELLERSALMIALFNYVNYFKISHRQDNTLNP